MAEESIHVLHRAMVVPAQPTPRRSLFLSCLDLFWRDIHYNQRLLFYETTTPTPTPAPDGRRLPLAPAQDGGEGAAAVMEKLKSSLALCLVHYYPWCGRISKGTEPPHRPFIDCCDAGVEFVEASSPLPLSHLARDGFQMKPFFQQLCQHPSHEGDSLFSSPLLSVQATLFLDGGLALGIAQSHVVADGQALWNFMVSWGECSRGLPLSLPPLHNRELLAVVDPSPVKATWSLNLHIKEEDKEEVEGCSGKMISNAGMSCTMKPDKDTGAEVVDQSMCAERESVVKNQCLIEDRDSCAGAIKNCDSNAGTNTSTSEEHVSSAEIDWRNASPAVDKTEPLVQYVLDLPASAIKKLKSEAGGGHTSFEVICAHFWKHLAAARGSAGREPTYFFTPVNCRTRMTPHIPSSYFGNAVAFDVALSTVGAIRREILCATACRVHDTVARIKEEFVGAFMHWLETHNNSVVDVFSASILTNKGLNTSSSPWFPAYQVDYGWGKPVAVRSAKVHGDGELVLFGGRPGSMPGDVEICTALPESVLMRLLEDSMFLPRPTCRRLAAG